MTDSNRPGDEPRQDAADITDVQATEIPEPDSLKTRVWNTAKVNEIQAKLAAAGIPWTDTPDDDWVRRTKAQLNKQGENQLASSLHSYIVRRSPIMRPMGREQQEKTRNAVAKEKKREERGTVENSRGHRVNKKRPMTAILAGGLLGALLLGGVVYGAMTTYKNSVAATNAERAAAQTAAANNVPVQQVDVADPNEVVDPNPLGGGPERVGEDSAPAGAVGDAAAEGAGTSQPTDSGTEATSATPTEQTPPVSAPPDTAALREQYNQGKRDGQVAGYSTGEQQGLAKGKQEGQQIGQQAGLQQGFAQGQQDGYAKGKQEGQQVGQQVGQQAGVQQGYKQGQQEGYVKGKEEGQQEGYQAAVQQVRQAQQAAPARTPITVPTPVTITPAPVQNTRTGSASSGQSNFGQSSAAQATRPPVTPPPAVPVGKLTFAGGGSNGQSGNTNSTARLTMMASGAGAGADGSSGSGNSSAASGRGSFELRSAATTAPAANTGFQLASAAPSGSAAGNGSAGAASGQPTGSGNGQLMLVSNPAAVPGAGEGASGGTGSTPGGSAGANDVRSIGGMTVILPGQGSGGNSGSNSGSANTAPSSVPGSNGSAGSSVAPSGSAGTVAALPGAVNFGPYRPYQTINAKLQTATLIMENSRFNLPVIAISSDGRKWIGTGAVGGAQRVYLTFSQMVDTDQKTVLPVPAAAYDASGTPGIQGSGQDLAPDIVRNLLRNAATGVRDYAQGQLNASKTTVQPNGNVVVEKAAPSLWTMVGSRALTVFDLPTNTQTFTRAVYLPAETPVVLMVGATIQQQ